MTFTRKANIYKKNMVVCSLEFAISRQKLLGKSLFLKISMIFKTIHLKIRKKLTIGSPVGKFVPVFG